MLTNEADKIERKTLSFEQSVLTNLRESCSLKGVAKGFFVIINSFSNIFYLDRKILPCFKRIHEKFWEKNP
jgi:hypothetical protein